MSSNKLPDYINYSMKDRTYRYLESTPMYPFGFGLSYSKFNYSDVSLSEVVKQRDKIVTASFQVQNISDTDAEEVIQLYITQPGSDQISPQFTLKQFKRVSLASGEEKTVKFKINSEMLESFNIDGSTKLELGTYKITIGNSSPGSRSKELGAFLVTKELDAF